MVADGKLSGKKGTGHSEITREDYQRLHPKLVGAFCRLGASAEEARDLTQETLLQAHKGLASFRGRSELDTWVVSIGKKVWLKHYRDQCRLKRSAEEIPFEAAEVLPDKAPKEKSHEDLVIARDLLARARIAILGLPEAMRQAFTLHLEGRKYRHIAALMDISENRVSSLVHQAREKMRRQAQEPPADPSP